MFPMRYGLKNQDRFDEANRLLQFAFDAIIYGVIALDEEVEMDSLVKIHMTLAQPWKKMNRMQ